MSYQDQTSEELFNDMLAARRVMDGAGGEAFRRLFALEAEQEKPIDPPTTDLDHNQIMAKVLEECPGEEMLARQYLHQSALYGDYSKPNWRSEWTLEAQEHIADTLFQGFIPLTPNGKDTQAGFRSAQNPDGSYQYLDNVKFKNTQIMDCGRWGARIHGVRRNVRFLDTVVSDIWHEHGIYPSTCGMGAGYDFTQNQPEDFALMFQDVLFHNNAGQAVQCVQRDRYQTPDPGNAFEHETPNPVEDMTPGLPIVFNRVSAMNVSQPGGARQSFNLSLFGARHAVKMSTVLIDNSMQTESRGFGLFQGYEGTGDPYKRAADLDIFYFKSAYSAQQCFLFDAMSRVGMSNGVIDVPEGSAAFIDFDNESDFDRHKLRNITSLRAPVKVRVKRKVIGTVDEISGAA